MDKYCVVLCSKKKPTIFQPKSTWFAVFDNKDDFDRWYTDEVRSRQEIIKEGIATEEEAKRIRDLAALNLYKK